MKYIIIALISLLSLSAKAEKIDPNKYLQYKYICVTDEANGDKLEQALKGAIIDGWEPFGGISVASRDSRFSFLFCQAIVKRKGWKR